ncbi:MarR family winged helix-turn-helix transcriptional regulator [Allostreptomyces psammosilenae]|uniref:DNA-binding MarR family transcriptional regulator n=1 Tax=Allostreptomyces psammosilenae TaxID=1892865 RepID=A0A853A384_9ACTN|nr:MarR family transcriptional regulator [Allostreptomyces psammosilenae]NYI04938.1 DNA-binding MarR family transcriptional regulator [Allostreptomyces psammosilenae]
MGSAEEPGRTAPGKAARELAAIERALSRIRRSQRRGALARQAVLEGAAPEAVAHLPVLDAVAEPPGEVTVGAVAERIGVDPSRASRMVAAAIGAGLVRRGASPSDGRRSPLELTAAGRGLLERARERRLAHIRRLTADWTDAERREFARLLGRFTDAL